MEPNDLAWRRGVQPRQLVKTLVVRLSEDDYRFVLVPGDREIARPKLRGVLGLTRMSMPSAEVAREVTGYERGAITPLGSTTPWPVIADATLTGTISIGAGAHGPDLWAGRGVRGESPASEAGESPRSASRGETRDQDDVADGEQRTKVHDPGT